MLLPEKPLVRHCRTLCNSLFSGAGPAPYLIHLGTGTAFLGAAPSRFARQLASNISALAPGRPAG